jgi:hypothetical protein
MSSTDGSARRAEEKPRRPRPDRWAVPATAFLAALSLGVVLMALAPAGHAPVAAAEARSVPEFADVGPACVYHDAIMGLKDQGSAGGYTDNTFRPENPILRAQFAKMIVASLGMPDGNGLQVEEAMTPPFMDLGRDDPATLYPHEYVAVLADRGVTLGTASGHFSPWRNISRAQVVTMVVRAAEEMYPAVIATPPAEYVGSLGEFDSDHAAYWRLAEYNGLLERLSAWGVGSDPSCDALRGEVAQILWNMLNAS